MNGNKDELLAAARAAARTAYAPYSGFRVGAAVRCGGDGAIFTGCNVENASYGLTLCAERVALASAVAAGRTDFSAIAVYAEGPDLPMPCGACRQWMAEFAEDLAVTVGNGSSSQTIALPELLPRAFRLRPPASPARPRSPRAGGR